MILVISIIVSSYLLLGIIWYGAKKKFYSHIRHSISELGESGSEYSRPVNHGLFLPVGILLFLTGIHPDADLIVKGLSFSLGAGYLVAALFPCDIGSPLNGSCKQQVHNLGGFVEYAGGVIFLFRVSEEIEGTNGFFNIIGAIVVVCTIIVSIPGNSFRGLTQRIAEVLLFGSLIYLSTI